MRYLFLLSFTLSHLFAIIDIATVDFKDKDEGFSGALYGSFQKKRGNTDKNEAEYGGRIQYDTDETITWLQGEVEKDEVSGITTDDNAFIHLRHIRQLYSPDWAMEFYTQVKRDKFKNVQNRRLFGIGPRYRLLDSDQYGKFFIGISFLDEKLNYTEDEPDPDEHNYRVSNYFSYKLPVNEVFDLSFLSYYQPKIDNGSDYLTSAIAEMTIHLTKVLDLSYLVEFDHDSQPATDIEKTDVVQKFSFVYRFGNDDPFSSYAHNFLQSLDELDDTNSSESIAVEVETEVEDIKDSSDTFAGEWSFGEEKFSIFLDGLGSYYYENGIYDEKLTWKLVSTETQEGVSGAKNQSTKLIIIRFEDEEGRPGRVENYLWSDNTLVGLSDTCVKVFKR